MPSLAEAITLAASRQTYYTIRLLVDAPRVQDAFRSYAYFRWVDDVLDAEGPGQAAAGDVKGVARVRFVERQRALLDECLVGDAPRDANAYEQMLVDLVSGPESAGGGLGVYLTEMMRVMEFDAWRRGSLVSGAELDAYTRSLAVAVTEAVAHFIGADHGMPYDATRYVGATGAHILHMLRDTDVDVAAGYYNVPSEVLRAGGIRPGDVESDAYRAWVRGRVQLARLDLEAGRAYLSRVPGLRFRLAGLAYMARFEWLIGTIERDGYRLRRRYPDGRSPRTALRMGWRTISWMSGLRRPSGPAPMIPSGPERRR